MEHDNIEEDLQAYQALPRVEREDPGDNPSAAAAIIYHKKWTGGNTATIYFNSRIDWNETTIRRVLIHELIHYYLFVVTGRRFFFSHGLSFVWVMLKINILYHEHITIYWHNKIPPCPKDCEAKNRKVIESISL